MYGVLRMIHSRRETYVGVKMHRLVPHTKLWAGSTIYLTRLALTRSRLRKQHRRLTISVPGLGPDKPSIRLGLFCGEFYTIALLKR